MAFEDEIAKLPPHELVTLKWHLMRREKQIPPTPLPDIWFLLGGRGSGKTLTGANHVYEYCRTVKLPPGRPVRVALVSETFTDVRITMIEGETGFRSIIPRDLEIAWNRSLGEYKFFIPGPIYREVHCFAYSSERPELLRGPQHHIVWLDEPAKLKDADKEPTEPSTTWSNMKMGLRLGNKPHLVVTGTPVPNKLVKYIIAQPNCVTHVMSSLENRENLPQALLDTINALPPTSRTYRQEVLAEILLDNPDSIIAQTDIDMYRADPEDVDELTLVLGYDPSMTANPDSDEAGIMLGGYKIKETEEDGIKKKTPEAYLLEDHSGHLDPSKQVEKVCELLIEKEIPEFIVEQNQGAGFVFNNIKTGLLAHPDVKEVHSRQLKKKATKAGTVNRWRFTIIFNDRYRGAYTFILHSIHARQNKTLRADQIAIRYQLGQVHHPTGGFPICEIPTCKASVEDQMVLWDESQRDSPDRMDAAVYVLLHIFGPEIALSSRRPARVSSPAKNADLPQYDPRGNLNQPVKVSRHSSVYAIEFGGSGVKSDRIGIGGPRRLPDN